MKYVELLRSRPIAVETKTANQQHYEVGTGVLQGMLGPRMKYSCALYEGDGVKGGLEEAEVRMLECYVERAGLVDGMNVLDLGYVSFLLSFFDGVVCFITCCMPRRLTSSPTTKHNKQFIQTDTHTDAAGAPSPSSSRPCTPTPA